MKPTRRIIEGHEFWLTTERACREDPGTGDLVPTDRYYCTFSRGEPGARNQGEFIKDDHGLVRLFPTAREALADGVRELEARIRIPPRAYGVGLAYRAS